MIRALRIAREIYHTEPHRSLIGREMTPGAEAKTDAELEAKIRELGHNRQHPLGTCGWAWTPMPSSTNSCACMGSNGCALSMHR